MTKTLQAAAPALRTIWIDYTNYRGERAWREIEPTEARPALWFGRTEWHPADQWLLAAFDIEKRAVRDFAVASIHAWSQQKPAALSAPPPSEEEAVKELMRLVTEHGNATFDCGEFDLDGNDGEPLEMIAMRGDAYKAKCAEASAKKEAIAAHASQMLRSAQEDARDAARYRWLVNTKGDHLHGLPSIWSAFDDDIDDYRAVSFWGLREKADLDGAIDAAMQKEAP